MPVRFLSLDGGHEPPRRKGSAARARPPPRPAKSATQMLLQPQEVRELQAFDPFAARPKPSQIPGGIRQPGPHRVLLGSSFNMGEESGEELPFYRALMQIDGLDERECQLVAEELQQDALALMEEALKPDEEDGWENGVELSLVLCGDDEMTRLNKKWMGKEYPTDVLSFPMDGDEGLLGDIVICLGTAKRQAEEGKIELRDELRVLLLHGFLHLLGYDHETGPEDMDEMAEAEVQMMKRMGWKGEGLISIAMAEDDEGGPH
eukprot:CAMPEP_0206225688 /NCGR_PEP_ID=MMETSP0047_2-20121206/7682_1 /ASSEMBLY_ACC=CAM_ASM_000192 /TAXON_ID=195065 /ORGANISM="Chroomonas mesostigmatica_cf, Strain CCMP1168" /LENGTH=261 /DNA_ID=CAMNT_0053648707 /DNA_START=38 /DNA_END=823 /DNA_ORIENTATION=-